MLIVYQDKTFEVIRSETSPDLVDLNVRLLAMAAPTATNQAERSTLQADARRNREAIPEAARQGFADHGFECQMEDIAAGAHVGVGAVLSETGTKHPGSRKESGG